MPLTAAALGGHSEFVKLLLQKGALVNFRKNSSGETVLHTALCKDNKKVIVTGLLFLGITSFD